MGSDVSLSKAVRANLLSLQNTASMMDKTQNRLATGNKVNSALDNPSSFFTASALNSRAADMSNLLDSMASGIKVIEAANNGITALTKNVESMQSSLRQARQDKSFQTGTFEVNENSVLSVKGGQFDAVSDIKLQTKEAGENAKLTTVAAGAYLGSTSSTSAKEGAGARSILTSNGGIDDGDKFSVAGVEVTAGSDTSAGGLAKSIQSALDLNSGTTGKYKVVAGSGDLADKVIIETVDAKGAAAAVTFGAGTTAATKGTTSFNYSDITSAIDVGGQEVPTGATFEDFVKNLKDKAEAGNYEVTVADKATGKITLTNANFDSNTASTASVSTLDVATATVGGAVAAGSTVEVNGVELTLGAFADQDGFGAELAAKINADDTLSAQFSATYDPGTDDLVLTHKVKGAGSTNPTIDITGTTGVTGTVAGTTVQGNDGIGSVPTVVGVPSSGNSSTTFDIDLTAAGSFTVGGKTVTSIGSGVPASPGTPATVTFTPDLTGVGATAFQIDGIAFNVAATSGTAATDRTTLAADLATWLAAPAGGNGAYTGSVNTTTGLMSITRVANTGTPVVITNGTNSPTAGTSVNGTAATPSTAETDASIKTKIDNALGTAPAITGYTVTVAAGKVSITSANDTALVATGTGVSNAVATNATAIEGVIGASVETVAAEKDTFTVTYDGKTAEISIGAVKGGVGATSNPLEQKTWQDETIAKVNADLKAAGINDLEAQFGTDGKFSIVAKNAEAKSIAIAGTDANAIFGTETVSTGKAAVQGYNAKGTVDKFVEEINRSHAGKLRASNDNGKLRIENLSTKELSVDFDSDGAGPGTAVNAKIEGNTVRANLSKQFNELRDQLDKLSDDASFNGINLLRGDKLKITFNESGSSSIDIQAKDKDGNVRGINASNLDIASLVAQDLDTDEGIDGLLAKLSTALVELRSQASSFGSNLSSVENRQSFTKNMINTLETGAANLTLADTNEEAANLLALQTRQQLSSSALSMASQQDQAVLQLLR